MVIKSINHVAKEQSDLAQGEPVRKTSLVLSDATRRNSPLYNKEHNQTKQWYNNKEIILLRPFRVE